MIPKHVFMIMTSLFLDTKTQADASDSAQWVERFLKLRSFEFLKVAFIQKVLKGLSYLQTDEPNYFPDQDLKLL